MHFHQSWRSCIYWNHKEVIPGFLMEIISTEAGSPVGAKQAMAMGGKYSITFPSVLFDFLQLTEVS
jgi:hypothetical protein